MGLVPYPILILGASGTIGSEIARRLARDGYGVILSGRDGGRLAALAAQIGPGATLEIADIADDDEVCALFSRLQMKYERLGGLVFCVATPFSNRLTHRIPWSVFAEQICVQLKALHLTATAALEMLKSGEGTKRFVLVSTEYVLGMPPIKTAPYVAAKAAMTAYAQVIAQEWLRYNIRVHLVAPGLVKSSLVADLPDEFLEQLAAGMPEKRLTTAEDVAAVVAFQMTDAADPLYGTPIRVSRGRRY